MRILDRLVASTFLKIYFAVLLGAPILFIIGDITENLDDYFDRGIPLYDIATAYLYQYPRFMGWAFPVAALVGAVFTIQGMTVNREIMAAKAGGISFRRIVAPIIVLSVLLTGLALWTSEVTPRANRRASEILLDRDSRRDWRANFVFEGEDGVTMAIQRLTVSDSSLQDIVVEAPVSEVDGHATHAVARQATFSEDDGWTFRVGYMRRLYPDGDELTFSFDEMRTRTITERPLELLEVPLEEEEMTYSEMGRMVQILDRSGGAAEEFRYKRQRKVAVPFMTFVIVLFGAPLATTSKRGGPAFGIGLAVGSVILYMMLLRVLGAFGSTGALHPISAAWIPNLIFLLTGIFLIWKVRT